MTLDEVAEATTELQAGQKRIEKRHEALGRDVRKILDVVVGPVATDWKGDKDPDGFRDETKGLMAKTEAAGLIATKLDKHLSNGGVPMRLPTNIKVAIWSASGTVTAAAISATATLIG